MDNDRADRPAGGQTDDEATPDVYTAEDVPPGDADQPSGGGPPPSTDATSDVPPGDADQPSGNWNPDKPAQ
jgi:hypothetical protein